MSSSRTVILLGPQRLRPTLDRAVESLGLDPALRLAAITAGWEEREPEDLELGEHLGGRVVNLRIHERADDVYQRDPELHSALRARHDRLRELQDLYRLRLSHLLQAARELMASPVDAALREPECADAIDQVRHLDAHHLRRVADIHAEFEQRFRPLERPLVQHHRQELRQQLEGCGALLVAGGHVPLLLSRMRLFGLPELCGDLPAVGWSGGAMVLSERIVLFHDSPPQGPGDPEVLVHGLGACPGVVALPHASKRLRLDDPTRVALFARRFAPALCAALDPETGLRWDGSRWTAEQGTRRLTARGELEDAA